MRFKKKKWRISETDGGHRSLILCVEEEMTVTGEPRYKYAGDLNEPDQCSGHVNFMMLLSPSMSITRCCTLYSQLETAVKKQNLISSSFGLFIVRVYNIAIQHGSFFLIFYNRIKGKFKINVLILLQRERIIIIDAFYEPFVGIASDFNNNSNSNNTNNNKINIHDIRIILFKSLD